MRRTLRTAFVVTAAVALGVLGFAGAADAHVTVNPDTATQGGYARIATLVLLLAALEKRRGVFQFLVFEELLNQLVPRIGEFLGRGGSVVHFRNESAGRPRLRPEH